MISSSSKSSNVIHNYWVSYFSQPWLLPWCNQLPTLHLHLYINRDLEFYMWKIEFSMLSSQITFSNFSKKKKMRSYFLFFSISHTTHSIYSEKVSSALSYTCTENWMKHFSSVHHQLSLSHHFLWTSAEHLHRLSWFYAFPSLLTQNSRNNSYKM